MIEKECNAEYLIKTLSDAGYTIGRLRQYILKASFAADTDRQAALGLLDEIKKQEVGRKVRTTMERLIHDSDCAMHNMPAYPNGPCDCGARHIVDMIEFAQHGHVAGEKDIDTCKKCGHDIRHAIHTRAN